MVQLCLDENILKLSGALNYLNANQCYKDGLKMLKGISASHILIDLSALEKANTLALALVIQWMRQLPEKVLRLTQMPEKMLGILRASHLEYLQAS